MQKKEKREKKGAVDDSDEIDHWTQKAFQPGDMPHNLLEESSFSTMFPRYREEYLRLAWDEVKRSLKPYHLKADLDLVAGTMTVSTTRKTWDPYIIVKARDMLKLLARSCPVPHAVRVLQDTTFCEIVKISGSTKNRETFVKRRLRLIGPNGSTLKALELLTNCYVLVQGNTVCIIGGFKQVKVVRRVVQDCMANVHPIYHIKELMIKRELEKDPALAKENWDRFLPEFKKRNVKKKKPRIQKGERSLFPPPPTPRKEDIQMETGEYFLNESEKHLRQEEARKREQQKKSETKRKAYMKAYEEPADAFKAKKPKVDREESTPLEEFKSDINKTHFRAH
eukprot:Filipodium_phascolosomae@DN8189_c0_g1_i1.p1